jgi:3-oxoacyl-[acyl-carrier protein] reductase
MDLQLTGKVAAVTGGSRGIGLATALRLAREGASVAICGRRADDLARAHALVEAEGARCLAFSCDLAEAGEAAAFIAKAAEVFGRIDALVCARGDPAHLPQRRADAGEASVRRILLHVSEAARAASPLMSQGGAVLLISSVCSDESLPVSWSSGPARAALEHAAISMAQELSPGGVRFNALFAGPTLLPGASRAGASRHGRLALAPAGKCPEDEVADLATFLVSPRASSVNGILVQAGRGLAKADLVSDPGAP